MRNNFNTSAFSELAFEIRDDPAEGWFRFTGTARYSPHRGLSSRIGPALLGTLKSARDFSYQLRDSLATRGPSDGQAEQELSPLDLALTGLGSCSMKTLIGGGSARGVTFEGVELSTLLTSQRSAEDAPRDAMCYSVDCLFEVNTSASQELMTELLEQVQEFSPNHRTLTDEMPLTVNFRGSNIWAAAGRYDAQGPAPTVPTPVERRIGWITGTQFESWPPGLPTAVRVPVDSPKQLTGADWGPNAQEHLLMGLAADIASHLNYFSVRDLGTSLPWEVTATASIDAAGMLDTGESLVGLQDTTCSISFLGEEEAAAATDLRLVVDQAVKSSTVRTLLTEPSVVDVSLKSGYAGASTRRIGRRTS
ncbi:OsmC family protein [Streptomyces mirabilis]|uniref:OsmC family protein n=1 Tax=Streptomyces mirabilis TaxID=68239 RepID=A0ABU3V5Y7_9ACTN|nr:OsmC family protein [Streptomyces mirabilis]MCX5357041.1 OsmC family protein [Streptomyces mirabilis]MDU9001578.1 OsmC family protein [Streptomyces mirabilis]